MYIKSLLASILLAPVVLATPIDMVDMDMDVEARSDQVHCSSGVRIMTARGSGVPIQHSGITQLGIEIADAIKGSASRALPYPANPAASKFQTSEHKGVAMMSARIKHYVDVCGPHSKIALMGYSQGAQVVGDTLIGYSGTSDVGLPPKYRDNIVAIVLFGDPSHRAGQLFNYGTGLLRSGSLNRLNYQRYAEYGFSAKMRSYCDLGDPYCASGNNLAVHTGYIGEYGSNAKTFVINHVEHPLETRDVEEE